MYGYVFMPQPVFYKLLEQHIQYCRHRYTQHHAGKSEEPTGGGNGHDHPEGTDPNGIPQDSGFQDISVNLSDDNDDNQRQ